MRSPYLAGKKKLRKGRMGWCLNWDGHLLQPQEPYQAGTKVSDAAVHLVVGLPAIDTINPSSQAALFPVPHHTVPTVLQGEG